MGGRKGKGEGGKGGEERERGGWERGTNWGGVGGEGGGEEKEREKKGSDYLSVIVYFSVRCGSLRWQCGGTRADEGKSDFEKMVGNEWYEDERSEQVELLVYYTYLTVQKYIVTVVPA